MLIQQMTMIDWQKGLVTNAQTKHNYWNGKTRKESFGKFEKQNTSDATPH